MRATREQLSVAAVEILHGVAGPDATPRPDQLAAAEALAVDGRRALVVQATGWGKSAVYWMAARALRDAGAGPTLVVSPLLALMRDQVDAASRSGLRAATLNSSNFDEWGEISAALSDDAIDVLLTSPERLANPRFAAEVLPWLLPRLGLLVIDEAHCISSWGHDFRPDYRRIAELLAARPDLPVLATTATANDRVTRDVAEQLGADTLVLRGTLARESLHLAVLPRTGIVEAFAWIDENLPALPGSGIVYVPTPQRADDLAGYLGKRGHVVRAYHGRVTSEDRLRIEDELRGNEVKAVIATSALGMGYDKPDLGFVVHIGSPSSPVDYYQQVGRAGRALDTALVVLLPTPEDEAIWKYFATATIPREDDAAAVLDLLNAAPEPGQVPSLSIATGISEGRLEFLLKVLAVEGAVQRTAGGWIGTGESWRYDRDRYDALLAAREHEADLMRAYARSARCLDAVLREALDDPQVEQCGRCSACVGNLPSGLRPAADRDHVEQARNHLRGMDVVLEPRKMWAPDLARRGRIAASAKLEPGRALAFASDPAWPEVSSLVDGADDEAPGWLVDAMVAVLARWQTSWVGRPTLVVPMPSSRHPRLIRSLADGIAAVGGGLPVVDAIAISGSPSPRDLATKARAHFQEPRISLDGALDDVGGVDGQTVLLVDDTWRSGWTATLAGSAAARGRGRSGAAPGDPPPPRQLIPVFSPSVLRLVARN